MYKLIVSDMDGTLLNNDHMVSEGNKTTLKELIHNNIHVAIATGRIYPSAKTYAKQLGILTPVIACNGAIIRNLENDEILYESNIKKEDALKVLEMTKENNLCTYFYTSDTFYADRIEKHFKKYYEKNASLKEEERLDMRIVENAYKHIENSEEHIYKMVIIDEDQEVLSDIRKKLEKIDSIEVSKSYIHNIEIMNKGVSKGNAVDYLAKSLGVKQEEVICFGDHENDMSMIEYAGLGVAMGNAEEMVKKIANYVTDTNNQDGVSKAIRKFVLK